MSGGGFEGDGGSPTEARLSYPFDMGMGPDGNIYIADTGNFRIRSVHSPVPGFDGTELVIASEDGTELYVFDLGGRHLQTLHALTGKVLREFDYEDGLLVGVTDAHGNTLGIARDDDGAPTAITAPFGQQTEIAVDDEGYLSTVTDPAGQQWQLSHTEDGLLVSRTDPRGHTSEYEYGEDGRLVEARSPEGAVQMLARTNAEAGFEVVHTSAEGRQTRYVMAYTPEGGQRQITESPSGGVTEVTRLGGAQHAVYPDGTQVTQRHTGDPASACRRR